MNLLVAGAFEAGSHVAHAINTVKMAQGFAGLGHRVTLVCRRPASGRVDAARLAADYGLDDPLRWIQLPAGLGADLAFAVPALLAGLPARPEIVYARSYTLPWLTSRLGIATVAESHAHPGNRSRGFERLVRAARRPAFRLWVTISARLARHYCERGVPEAKLVVLPDAVDLRRFRRPPALPPSPYEAGRPAVVYVGHLYDYKGIPAILAAAERLPAIAFHLVGGLPDDLERQTARVRERGLRNVTLHGPVPHARVPFYLWHADALLLPPSAQHPSAAWTSPLKLGEYLASGAPVVASDVPALRDLVCEAEVCFAAPDSGEALAEAVAELLARPDRARELARAGARRAESLSYVGRARALLERALPAAQGSLAPVRRA